MLIQHLYFPKSKDTALYINYNGILLLNIEYGYYGIHVLSLKCWVKCHQLISDGIIYCFNFIFYTFMAGNVEPIF